MFRASLRPLALVARSSAPRPPPRLGLGLGRRNASSIAQKYSNAAFRAALAKSPQVLSKVQGELAAIQAALKEQPALQEFILNPLISAKDRIVGLEAIYKAAASKGAKEPIGDTTRNLLAVLAENGRLRETPSVIEGFNELMSKHRGELEIIVTSNNLLPKDILAKLESILKQSEAAKQAKVVKVVNKVNPNILGGLLVEVGDKTIDLSALSRVTKLNQLLQQSV